jgi:hypothetical protein
VFRLFTYYNLVRRLLEVVMDRRTVRQVAGCFDKFWLEIYWYIGIHSHCTAFGYNRTASSLRTSILFLSVGCRAFWFNTNILYEVVECPLKGSLAVKSKESYGISENVTDKVNIVLNVLKSFRLRSMGIDHDKFTHGTV